MQWIVAWYLRDSAGKISGGEMADNANGETPEEAAADALTRKPKWAKPDPKDKALWIMRPQDPAVKTIVGGTPIETYEIWTDGTTIAKISKTRKSKY